jgi:hypothetical protein
VRTLAIYLLLRLAIFGACFAVLYLLFGNLASGWLIALLSLLFTSGLSLLLLRGQGDAAGRALSDAVQRVRSRFEQSRSREDVD